jgi:ribosomal protein S27AE
MTSNNTTNGRPNTPDRINDDGSRTITTKRACNGCGQLLGDITNAEMQAAIAGAPLPDVRRECPACGPTAPEPACVATVVVAGDQLCLELECDHTGGGGSFSAPPDSYCDEVREETVCATHSRFETTGWGDELVHAEPWPCKHGHPVSRPSV